MEATAPAHDEIQIVVLGKGIGECVLIHLGDGEWVIVDSFKGSWRGSPRREPAALA